VSQHTTIRDDALRPDDLTREYGWPLSNQKRARRKGNFPPCYRIGRRLYWRRSTIDAWIAEQEAKTEAPNGGGDHVAE
jgi:predicted DNA-binding transcriptional regulator AlpA